MNNSNENGVIKMNNQSDMDSSEFLHSLWYVSRSLMRFVHKAALENDLSIPQYSLILAIAPHKEMTQKQIGEKLQIPKSTLSQAVDGLVQAGWLYREPVQDNRREIQLILSEKGVALFEKMSAQKGSIHQTIQSVMDTLTKKQCTEIQTTLLHIADFIEKETNTKEIQKND